MTGEIGPVGFIGTGTIGAPMAKRLLEAGHARWCATASRRRRRRSSRRGRTRAASPREVAAACRVVFTSLPGPAQVEEVATGLLEARARRGRPRRSQHQRLRRGACARGARGGGGRAARGRAGLGRRDGRGARHAHGDGERGARCVRACRALLAAFGKNIFYLGDSGNGTLTKLVNNAIFLCGGLLVQETLRDGGEGGARAEPSARGGAEEQRRRVRGPRQAPARPRLRQRLLPARARREGRWRSRSPPRRASASRCP